MKLLLVKSFRILTKFIYLIKNDGFFFTVNKLSTAYKDGSRKAVTKTINIRYKIITQKDNLYLYSKWIDNIESQDRHINTMFSYEPLISVLMSIPYNSSPNYLKDSIESILNQTYKNWELCIAIDSSLLHETLELLKKYEKIENIKIVYCLDNRHISNEALSLASGDYMTFLDQEDIFSLFALYEIINVLNKNKNIKLIYSDEDKIDENGKRFEPHFKPDWNPDMFFSQNYISDLIVIKKDLIHQIEAFREGYVGLEGYDLVLRCLTFIKDDEIFHISKILYHSRVKKCRKNRYLTDVGIKLLEDYFKEKEDINVRQGLLLNTYKVTYPLENVLVSLIIPTKDNYDLLYRCINSILKKTAYKNYEIIIVDNQTTQKSALSYLKELDSFSNIQVLKYSQIFNYSKINNYAVKYASGNFLAFLNNDIEVLNEEWLEEMLQHSQRKEIGIVGAKLYYEDMTIQHAGIVLGIGTVAGHSHKYFEKEASGYFSRLKIIQNYSALTAACIVLKKSIFEEVNGFDENLQVAFNDIDLSLKILEKGYRNLWTPYAELIHYESKSRGFENTKNKKARFDKEIEFMKEKWGIKLLEDRCYNRNLTLEHEDFSLKIEEKN